jgi:hypothetical protein
MTLDIGITPAKTDLIPFEAIRSKSSSTQQKAAGIRADGEKLLLLQTVVHQHLNGG